VAPPAVIVAVVHRVDFKKFKVGHGVVSLVERVSVKKIPHWPGTAGYMPAIEGMVRYLVVAGPYVVYDYIVSDPSVLHLGIIESLRGVS